MPIDTSPQHVPGSAYQVTVPPPLGVAYQVQVTLYADGSEGDTAELINPVIQSLVDLLQGWDGKRSDGNVVAQGPLSYAIAPTNLVEPPPPEPDPNA